MKTFIKKLCKKFQWQIYSILALLIALGTIQLINAGISAGKTFHSFMQDPIGIDLVIPTVNAKKSIEEPKIITREIASEAIRRVSAYNVGVPAQTDSSPCISANGEDICRTVALGYKRCAANFVPLGTDLLIDNFGQCKVVDRMNSRYPNSVDIAMSADEIKRARQFGIQKLNIKILK